ncbi:MAG: ATP-binding cassette domain-containing protein [Prevotellaceae bacterium]|nr:ATP-binding cassette domain-containing protein [Prevotellaceae bacterium]MDO4932123.1 ATP-binding cassette domain-containing protein [Prevotellaceae bacterium]
MNKIIFDNVTPNVFKAVSNLNSDIWQTKAVFEKGKTYLVAAESGKGKSTFCSYIMGYRHDYSGSVLFDNEDITQFNAARWTQIRQCNISHVFQELRLFPELTALENILIKNQLTQHVDENKIMKWFDRFGIPEKINTKIGLMSFGQQQRVAMMRALSQPFDILLADEPTSHLDDRNSQIMAEIMLEEAQAKNACIIVTSIGKHMQLKYDKLLQL